MYAQWCDGECEFLANSAPKPGHGEQGNDQTRHEHHDGQIAIFSAQERVHECDVMDVKFLLLVYFLQAFWRFKHKYFLPPTDLLAREDHHQQSPGQGHQIGALGTLLFKEFRFRQDNEKTDGGDKEQYRREAFDDVVFIRTTAQRFHVQNHPYDETGEESEAQNRCRNDVLRKH